MKMGLPAEKVRTVLPAGDGIPSVYQIRLVLEFTEPVTKVTGYTFRPVAPRPLRLTWATALAFPRLKFPLCGILVGLLSGKSDLPHTRDPGAAVRGAQRPDGPCQ